MHTRDERERVENHCLLVENGGAISLRPYPYKHGLYFSSAAQNYRAHRLYALNIENLRGLEMYSSYMLCFTIGSMIALDIGETQVLRIAD